MRGSPRSPSARLAAFVGLSLSAFLAAAGCSHAETPEPVVEELGEPAAAPEEGADAPLLWLPRGPSAPWDGLLTLMASEPKLRLTMAVPSSQFPADYRERLVRLVDEGRLEFALRLEDDPVLPLLVRLQASPRVAPVSRVRDIAEGLALARQAYREYFGRSPKGLAPAGGAVPPQLYSLLRSMGIEWVAVGPDRPEEEAPEEAAPAENGEPPVRDEEAPVPEPPDEPEGEAAARPAPTPWRRAGGLTLVPFDAARPLRAADGTRTWDFAADGRAVVLDEAVANASEGALEELVSAKAAGFLFWTRPAWTSVETAAAARAIEETDASAEPAPWTGDLSPWTGRPAQRAAWAALAAAASALERYQNSGRAQVPVLDKAVGFLRIAESGRLFLALGRESELEADARFRDALRRMHQAVGSRPPESLQKLLAESAEISEPEPREVSEFVLAGDAWLEASDPEGDAKAPDAGPSASPWDLRSFRLEWTERELVFVFRLAAPPEDGRPAPVVEAYIDLNRRIGSGSTVLLHGRPGYLKAEDAWEFALTASPEQAALFRAGRGAPDAGLPLRPSLNKLRSELIVRVPRDQMRGSPLKWGFVVVSAAQPAEGAAGGPIDLVEPAQAAELSGRLLGAFRPSVEKDLP